MKVGYARVSNLEQDIRGQIQTLKEAGCKWIFKEHASEFLTEWTELERLIVNLQKGDILVIEQLCRIGKSVPHLVDLLSRLQPKTITLVSLMDNLEINPTNLNLIIKFLNSVSKFEKNIISEKTKGRLKLAQKKGVRLGKPPGLSNKGASKAHEAEILFNERRMTISMICKKLAIGRSTFYRYMKIRGVK